MSDRLLPVPAIRSLPFPSAAKLWRTFALIGRVVVRRQAPAGAEQHQSAAFLPDRMAPPPRSRRTPALGPLPRKLELTDRLRRGWRRYRSRQEIARLNAHLLKDIGVTYAEAEAEANKPFWAD